MKTKPFSSFHSNLRLINFNHFISAILSLQLLQSQLLQSQLLQSQLLQSQPYSSCCFSFYLSWSLMSVSAQCNFSLGSVSGGLRILAHLKWMMLGSRVITVWCIGSLGQSKTCWVLVMLLAALQPLMPVASTSSRRPPAPVASVATAFDAFMIVVVGPLWKKRAIFLPWFQKIKLRGVWYSANFQAFLIHASRSITLRAHNEREGKVPVDTRKWHINLHNVVN